jgi:hypothetical protein
MTVSHGHYPVYQCRRAQLVYASGQCQAFPVRELDQVMREVFLQAMEPAPLQNS